MRNVVVVFALSFALSLAADPVVTSVSPESGPVAGGTTVTIKGTGFNNTCILCSPPFADPKVYFGYLEAKSVRLIDATTIEAVTPAHLPTTVSVRVHQFDGSRTDGVLPSAFLYFGHPEDAFETILFPIFMRRPVDGAFGSRFEMTARVAGRDMSSRPLYGIDTTCYLFSPTTDPFQPVGLGSERQLLTGCSQSVGRLFYTLKGSHIAANLRVRDTTRQASSHGVEIPVVTRDDFSNDGLAFLGVPADPRFRKMLRVYALGDRNVPTVVINGVGVSQLIMPPSTLFEPGYAEFTDFPEDLPPDSTFELRLVQGKGPGGTILPDSLIWGFLSITNNETQEITIISPQP